ncbi:MAG TPA: alpha-1,2-fucosyltransferase [Chitinophagaceae bacterium]|nr:alpha-1,2-fucosyltransferase [Chitinophagaceae bacterium]
MIISQIIGGLGNQMFQYAAGKTLARLNNTVLKLDVSAFEEYKLRDFALTNFHTNVEFATKKEINDLLPAHNFEKAFQYFSPLKKRSYYREKEFHFDEKVLKLGKNVYLKGYFQSEKYFLPAKEIIKQEYKLKYSLTSNVNEFANRINNEQSVAVHIRRGDMRSDPLTSEYHGILPVDHYQKSVDIVNLKVLNPIFYLFSDDINWVKENLQIPNAIHVSNKITNSPIEDLYLMSQCKHNIIANSSFSWWGAWLNNNPDKIVIAPKNWFNKGPKDTQDLIPNEWLKI